MKNYRITKKSKSVNIELSNDAYKSLFNEVKAITEVFANSGMTLIDIANRLPICTILMASYEVVKDLKVGDKMFDEPKQINHV